MEPKQISEGERKDQEAMKNWLSFLPEIKREIQSYLALPQNKKSPVKQNYVPYLNFTTSREVFSRLQNSAAVLEALPSVTEIQSESDTKKLHSIFREFESAKLAARLAILTIRTNLELGIEDNGVSVSPDGIDHQWNEFTVRYSWAVNILPFFHVPARISVIFQESRYQVAVGVSLSNDNISTSVIKVELPKDWIDPLEKPLRELDLFQYDNSLSLDGIEYELTSRSRTSKGTLWFGNPSTSPFIEIERAFFSVAEMAVNEKGQIAEKDYLAQWSRYLAKPKNA